MSFAPALHKVFGIVDPGVRQVWGKKMYDDVDLGYQAFKPKTPPPTPGVPNPNDAANAAQSTTDQMRMRRGLLANVYAGSSSQAPVTGKTALGT